jgi:hypothetical protein
MQYEQGTLVIFPLLHEPMSAVRGMGQKHYTGT